MQAHQKLCRENGYAYSFDEEEKGNVDTYPFVILAPSYAKEDLLDAIRAEAKR